MDVSITDQLIQANMSVRRGFIARKFCVPSRINLRIHEIPQDECHRTIPEDCHCVTGFCIFTSYTNVSALCEEDATTSHGPGKNLLDMLNLVPIVI
jgi:hypothetical protein